MAKICLITPGQPSSNPRLIKEADALIEAGHTVHVIYGHWAQWADAADKELLSTRKWTYTSVMQELAQQPLWLRWNHYKYRLSYRLRYKGLRYGTLDEIVSCGFSSELRRKAKGTPADLYIAHYPGALSAAVSAAQYNCALVGFDIEDFYSGMDAYDAPPSISRQINEYIENKYLRSCDYLTAASPDIADAYAAKYNVGRPLTLLNVFPLAERPLLRVASKQSGPLKLYWFSQTIGPRRGIEDVVRAMGLLPHHDIELHLRGEWFPGYQEEILKLADSYNVRRNCIISYPPVVPDEMIRSSTGFDVGLALEQKNTPFRDLCLTNKLFTYLLAGNAIIATSTHAQEPLVNSLENAATYYCLGDIQALSDILDRWYQDRAVLEEARQRAWDWGTTHYNWDMEKHKFLHLIEKTLSGTPKQVVGGRA